MFGPDEADTPTICLDSGRNLVSTYIARKLAMYNDIADEGRPLTGLGGHWLATDPRQTGYEVLAKEEEYNNVNEPAHKRYTLF
jgi:hypothetical protein